MIYTFTLKTPKLIEKKFSVLEKICTALVETDNISAVADQMLNLAMNNTNAEKGSLMLLNESGELYILAAKGIDAQRVEAYREKIGEGIAGIVAKNQTPVLVHDIDKDRRFRLKKRNHYKTKSFISCPVICRNRLLGVFNINDKKNGKPFLQDEFALLLIIANQAAITLENATLLTQLRSKAAELEDINRRLSESAMAKTAFLARISHELRTPLNSIKGSIYYLEQNRKISREKQEEFFKIIAQGANDLSDTVENLLNFVSLEDETRVVKAS